MISIIYPYGGANPCRYLERNHPEKKQAAHDVEKLKAGCSIKALQLQLQDLSS